MFAQRFTLPPLATLDIDGNGLVDALTDGLLDLRHRFGFTGTGSPPERSAPTACVAPRGDIQTYINGQALVFDIDNNGALDALTDGLLILRFMFGFTGTTLTTNAVAPNCFGALRLVDDPAVSTDARLSWCSSDLV